MEPSTIEHFRHLGTGHHQAGQVDGGWGSEIKDRSWITPDSIFSSSPMRAAFPFLLWWVGRVCLLKERPESLH